MASTNDYAALSADVYRDSFSGGNPPAGWTRLSVNGNSLNLWFESLAGIGD